MNILLVFSLSFFSFLDDVQEPSPEVKKIHAEIRTYFNSNQDSAILLATHAVELSNKLGDNFGEAVSLALLAKAFDLQGNTNLSVSNFFDALKKFKALDGTKSQTIQANLYLSIGKVYQEHHRLNEAIEFYDKGLQNALKSANQNVFVKLLHNKAVVTRMTGDLLAAKKMLIQKSNHIQEGDKVELLYTYNQLGLIYSDLQFHDTANTYYDSIITITGKKNISKHLGWAYHNKALNFLKQKQYDSAWQNFQMALVKKERLNDPKDLLNTYQDIAELALIQGNHKLALSYAEKATSLLTSAPKTPEYYDQYQLLSRCIRVFDPLKALAYADLHDQENATFIALQNELIALGEGYKMDLITTNYFNDQRQLQQKIRLYWTVSCGLIFFLVAGYLSIRVWRIYHYVSPKSSIDMIKNRNEFVYLFDLLRKEREETRITLRQLKDSER